MDLTSMAKASMRNIKSYYGDHQLNFKADNLKSLQILRPLALSITQVTYVPAVAFLIYRLIYVIIFHIVQQNAAVTYISAIIKM